MFPSNSSTGGGHVGDHDAALLHAYAEQYLFCGAAAAAAAAAADVNVTNFSAPSLISKDNLHTTSPPFYNMPIKPACSFHDAAAATSARTPTAKTAAIRGPMAAADLPGFGRTQKLGRSFPGLVRDQKGGLISGSTAGNLGKKRSPGKKDRHSKICTARGPRDRRMRLSLDIARAFFDLQDVLGFDKASKTVGWLLDKSKAAIKELKRGGTAAGKGKLSGAGSTMGKSASSVSEEGEATSGVDETTTTDNVINDNCNNNSGEDINPDHDQYHELEKVDCVRVNSIQKVAKKTKASRKSTTTFDQQAKESRAMARARARARTKEKLWERRLEHSAEDHQSPLRDNHQSAKSLHVAGGAAENIEEPSSQSQDSGVSPFDNNYHHHLPGGSHDGVNADPLVSQLQNNDVINFFRQSWEINCPIPDAHLHTNGNNIVHERQAAACPAVVFGSPADHINRHHQPHFVNHEALQFLVKPWEGY